MSDLPNEIFIYCDDPSHPQRKPIAHYRLVPSDHRPGKHWHHLIDGLHDGQKSMQATLRHTYGYNAERMSSLDTIYRHTLRCPVCNDRPQALRVGKMSAAFDRLREQGIAEVSLAGIAAIVAAQAQATDREIG